MDDTTRTEHRHLFLLLCTLCVCVLILISLLHPFRTATVEIEKQWIEEPTLTAHAYIVQRVDNHVILAKRRDGKPLAPASLIKIMTAAIAVETIPKNTPLTFSKETREVEEKRSPAKAGETYTLEHVLQFALIESGNDAAMLLAASAAPLILAEQGEFQTFTFAERVERFTMAMNEKAIKLGLKHSYFKNPTGLDEEGQYASAEDIATTLEYVWRTHPELLEISRIYETTISSETEEMYTIQNTNMLLKEFPAIIGSKTGFTDNAKGALAMMYPIRPHGIVSIVILGSEDRFGDGRKIIQWLENIFP